MKACIFATSYINNGNTFENRILKWINYYQNIPFSNNKTLFLIDNGS